ncbi:MAG: thioredoxin family protein [Opitutales bacterium]
MKKIILISIASLFALSAFAQKQEVKAPAKAPEVKAVAKAPEAKAASLDNVRDPQKAMEMAKNEGKILAYHFTGSAWCPPCMQLEAKVMHNKEFIDYAKENIIYVNMDNNRREFIDKDFNKEYERLAIQYAISGFPTVILINPKNNNIEKLVGYSGMPVADYIKKIEAFKTATPKR